MKYKMGKAQKGKKIYFFVKDTETGQLQNDCTRYLKHKTLQNRSVNTIKRIAQILPFYMNYLDDHSLTLSDVSKMRYAEQTEHFSGFLSYVKEGHHTGTFKQVKNNTANYYLQTVFGLYEYLHRCGSLDYLKVLDDRFFSYSSAIGTNQTVSYKSYDGYLRKNESVSRIASKDQIQLILSACTNNRDRLLILIMEETGLRIGEALGIRYTEDIDYERKRLHVRYRTDNPNQAHAKNAEERFVRISDTTFALLNLYLAENADLLEQTDYLFIVLNGKTRGRPLTAKSFYSVLGTIGKRIGLPVTNHMLRHYYADERRRANWSLLDISKSLGHKNLATTENYLHVTSKEVEDAQDLYLRSATKNVNISDFL